MTFVTATGTKVYIAPSVTAEPANAAAYAALTWTEIGSIVDAGEIGDNANIVTTATLADGRVQKLKGASDAGTANLMILPKTSDTGQAALIAAQGTPNLYPFKYVLNNALDAGGEGETHYFCAIVTGKRMQIGKNDSVVQRTVPLAVTTKVTEVAATAGP